MSVNKDYDSFVEKFKPKKTTDDCYTPQIVYDAIAGWVAREYHADPASFMRPFYPGGNYEAEEYGPGAVVVDNPPFSILAQIVRFYMERGVRFFLFSPTLTLLTRRTDVTHIACGATITYANGAQVNTSFITNMDEPGCILRSAPELYRLVIEANTRNLADLKKHVPRYAYPDSVITAAAAYQFSRKGVEWRLHRDDCVRISALDEQKKQGKSSGIFGGGYLLSDRATADRVEAEATARRLMAEQAARENANDVTVWKLSDRERQVVAGLGGDRNA